MFEVQQKNYKIFIYLVFRLLLFTLESLFSGLAEIANEEKL